MEIEFISDDGPDLESAIRQPGYVNLIAYLPSACSMLAAVAVIWALRLPFWRFHYDLPPSEAPNRGYLAASYDQWGHGTLDNGSGLQIDRVTPGLSTGQILVVIAAVLGLCGVGGAVQVWRRRDLGVWRYIALAPLCTLIGVLVVEFAYLTSPLASIVDTAKTMQRTIGAGPVMTVAGAGLGLIGCAAAWLPAVRNTQSADS